MKKLDHFDAIVVGGGLAGLSAAYELGLRHKRVLVLEAGDQLGGKIITCRWKNVAYECGALFAFEKDWVPFPIEPGRRMAEDHPIGVFLNGRLVAANSVPTCLQAIGLQTKELLLLKNFFDSESPQAAMIGERTYAVLNGFFQVIHPGELTAYVPARRRDSLICHNTAHFQHGNGALISAFVENSLADIRTGCRVIALSSENGGVTVHWRESDGEKRAWSNWVILATPAYEAKVLTSGLETVSTTFLDKIRYGEGIAVILGLHNMPLQPFSYIVSPEGQVNTFIFHHDTGSPGMVILTAYLVAEKAHHCRDNSNSQLIELVRSELNRLNIGVVESENVAFSDVYRWTAVGPVISDEAYKGFSKACLRPSERIVLAGDYTWWNGQQMPYGLQAAILSGQRAARMVCDEAETAVVTRFQPEPLAMSSVTVLTDRGPKFKEQVEDGTIAYYGLILEAKPDIEMERYLIAEAEDGLWAYQQNYGVTSLDSALVIEGLLATGYDERFLNHSVDRLVEEFFDVDAGGFRTLPHERQGRAPYWQGADCPATAYCAWLLQQIAPQRYAGTINACAGYLTRKQFISGHWPGKWFPSNTIPVFYAVRLLMAMGDDFRKSCRQARLWLCSRQDQAGSWMGSIIESAAAIRALCALDGPQDCIGKGCDWIRRRRTNLGWPGEPILQYWFEDEKGRKFFFHTRDKGQITTAWATIALREADCQEDSA